MGCAPKVNLLGIRRTIKSQRRQRPEIFWPSNRKRQAAHPSQRLFQPESSRPGRPDLPAYRRRARSLRPTLRRHPRIFRTGGAIELDIAPSIAEDPRPSNAPPKRARAIETGIFALGRLGQLNALATSDRAGPAQLPIGEALSRARALRAGPPGRTSTGARRSPTASQRSHSRGEKYDPASGFPPALLQIGSDFSSAGLN
jgi:hypothetical protein